MKNRMNQRIVVVLLLVGISGSAWADTFITDGGEWSVATNWSEGVVPGDNVFAWIDDVGAVVSDTVDTRARPTIGEQANTTGSLTIKDGGEFIAARSFTIGNNLGSSGALVVEKGGRFELSIDGTTPQFFMGDNVYGSATLDISGTMELLGVGTHLSFRNDTEPQTIKLTDGYLQIPTMRGLSGTDTNINFEMQKGLFVIKIHDDGGVDPYEDRLYSLATNGYIDYTSSENGNEVGWGMTQLGITNYATIDYALTFGRNTLYIDATQGTWADDSTVLAMWMETSAGYGEWAASYSLAGPDADRDADPDEDGNDNLVEYALDGDPNVSDAGDLQLLGTAVVGGTNFFEYVYKRRLDADTRGLIYTLTDRANLAFGDWATNTTAEVAAGPVDSDFESVTNRWPTDGNSEQFIQLQIKED